MLQLSARDLRPGLEYRLAPHEVAPKTPSSELLKASASQSSGLVSSDRKRKLLALCCSDADDDVDDNDDDADDHDNVGEYVLMLMVVGVVCGWVVGVVVVIVMAGNGCVRIGRYCCLSWLEPIGNLNIESAPGQFLIWYYMRFRTLF